MANDTRNDDRDLDETIEETFPASDPPANTVETGIRVGEELPVVADNRDAHRFELTVDGQTAFLSYDRRSQSMVLLHTEVPPGLRGQHLGERLADAAIRAARAEGLPIVIECPFVRDYVRRHPSSLM